jgi:hypothetical protein
MEMLLSKEESVTLAEAITEYLLDLRTEILDTDDFDFKLRLKRKEQILRDILAKVQREGVPLT